MADETFDDLFEASDSISRGEAKRLVADEVSKTLRDIYTFNAQAQAGQQAAIREVAAAHPDFEQRRPQMMAVLQEIPLLRDALNSAESNPQLSGALPQMYETLYRASHGPATGADADKTATAASEPSKVTGGPSNDLSSEGVQYSAALASQKVDLSPANRKTIIAALEAKGVGDVEF